MGFYRNIDGVAKDPDEKAQFLIHKAELPTTVDGGAPTTQPDDVVMTDASAVGPGAPPGIPSGGDVSGSDDSVIDADLLEIYSCRETKDRLCQKLRK